MEYSRVGNHEVAVCPHCDMLFSASGEPVDGMQHVDEQYQAHLATSRACQAANDALPTMEDLQREVGPVLRRNEEERQRDLDANPDNGKLGYWLVEGIRHDARCRAVSAREAVDKCVTGGAVGDWESARATFLGKELPDVF